MNDERVRQHAAAGLTRAIHPDAKEHFRAILECVDPDRPTELEECTVCGKVGLPERIERGVHECL